MASKEVMVSAPLIVLLYDRTFLAGSFNHAVRRRAGFYAALAGAWLLLGGLVIAANNRGGTAGFDSGLSSWKYLCTQFGAIVHYLRLSLWPYPLLLDYGTSMAKHILEIVPYAIIVAALASVTAVALWRWPKVGFLGAWFFAILAPTSSIVPVTTQTVAEHRMYLPLAAVLAALVVGGYAIGRQLAHRGVLRLSTWLPLSGSLWVCMAVALAILTVQRNNDYSSELAIWADTAAKAPTNARAQGNFGRALAKQGQIDEAIIHYQKALEIRPDYADVHNNFGLALATRGQADDAIVHYQKALDVDPAYVPAHNDLGLALLSRGQVDEAIIHFRRAVSLRPDLTEVENNLGMALARRGQLDEAIVHYTKALTMNPAYAEAENNLGNALARRGQLEDAVAHYRAALKINPHFVAARQNLRVAMNRLP
jgi:Flp pilus assembly protein TadD